MDWFCKKDSIIDGSESIVSGSEIALDLPLSSESGSSEVYPTEDICEPRGTDRQIPGETNF